MRGVLMGLAAVLMASCATAGPKAPEEAAYPGREILAEQQGQVARVAVGEPFRVRLRGIPTAGYVWALAGPPPGFLDTAGEETLPTTPQQREPGFTGGEHWMTFAFKAREPGKGDLKLAYGRPWELEAGAAPEETFTVTIEAQ